VVRVTEGRRAVFLRLTIEKERGGINNSKSSSNSRRMRRRTRRRYYSPGKDPSCWAIQKETCIPSSPPQGVVASHGEGQLAVPFIIPS